MSDITIKEVSAKKDFREFLRFPYSLFKDDKMWVPPLIADEKTTFNKKKNPALEFCDYKIFMAYRDGKAVAHLMSMEMKFSYCRNNKPQIQSDLEREQGEVRLVRLCE